MAKGFAFTAVEIALTIMSAACASPTAPSSTRAEVLVAAPAELSETDGSAPVVTLLPDLTASPAEVTVSSGSRLQMINNSGQSVRLHSYNCSEFSLMALPPGYSRNTRPFSPAGKTCDYFAWDANWSRKLFEGRVFVR